MGSGSTFVLTGAGDVLGDISSFLTGPSGDPARIRQVAAQVEGVNAEYQGHVAALNSAVDTLTSSWTGDAAGSFRSTWFGAQLCGAGPRAPSQVLAAVSSQMAQFAQQLCDYADALEHAQHEHWIEMGVLAAMAVVSAAQLGADPVTDAAAAGAASGMEVGASISMGALGVALQGGLINFGADVVAQLGADLWDGTDPLFNQTGDDVVPAFDVGEAATSGLSGAVSFAIPGALGALAGPSLTFSPTQSAVPWRSAQRLQPPMRAFNGWLRARSTGPKPEPLGPYLARGPSSPPPNFFAIRPVRSTRQTRSSRYRSGISRRCLRQRGERFWRCPSCRCREFGCTTRSWMGNPRSSRQSKGRKAGPLAARLCEARCRAPTGNLM